MGLLLAVGLSLYFRGAPVEENLENPEDNPVEGSSKEDTKTETSEGEGDTGKKEAEPTGMWAKAKSYCTPKVGIGAAVAGTALGALAYKKGYLDKAMDKVGMGRFAQNNQIQRRVDAQKCNGVYDPSQQIGSACYPAGSPEAKRFMSSGKPRIDPSTGRYIHNEAGPDPTSAMDHAKLAVQPAVDLVNLPLKGAAKLMGKDWKILGPADQYKPLKNPSMKRTGAYAVGSTVLAGGFLGMFFYRNKIVSWITAPYTWVRRMFMSRDDRNKLESEERAAKKAIEDLAAQKERYAAYPPEKRAAKLEKKLKDLAVAEKELDDLYNDDDHDPKDSRKAEDKVAELKAVVAMLEGGGWWKKIAIFGTIILVIGFVIRQWGEKLGLGALKALFPF